MTHDFYMTMHLLTGRMLDRLQYLNADLRKCLIHHILLTWHQVITICFQFWKKGLPLPEIFGQWWAQVCNRRVVENAVWTVVFYRRWKTPRSLQTVHWQRQWPCWKVNHLLNAPHSAASNRILVPTVTSCRYIALPIHCGTCANLYEVVPAEMSTVCLNRIIY